VIKLIKYFLNLFGIYIYRSDWKLHYKNQEKKNKAKISFNELYSKYYNKKNNKLIIFDVGANTGQSIKRFNNEFNLKEIHCFEPNVPAFEKLKKIKSKNIFLNNLALGDKEKIQTFNNYPKTSSSSFYRIDKKSSIYEMNKGFYSSNVKIITLDKYIEDSKIDKINILKIDTQGFEVSVLKGAINAVKDKRIDFIETEINLGFQYEIKTSFKEIENQLFDNYVLLSIDEAGDIISNFDFQINVIYANKDLIDKFE
jgi:FkbM family methyltransferase